MKNMISVLAITLWVLYSVAQASTSTTNFAVGNCEPGLTSYGTISEAVLSVPPAATILLCPGNYPEQVTITKPLTLQGVKIGDADAAVLVEPVSGWAANGTDGFGSPIAAQILVQNTTQVTLSNLIVDGNPGANCSIGFFYGIYYQSSSGTINRAVARNQISNANCGFPIWLENDNSTATPTVTVQNSSVHGFDPIYGINAISSGGGSMTVNITSSFVSGGQSGIGIFFQFGSNGTISGNTIEGTSEGVVVVGNATVKGNRIVGSTNDGIHLSGASTVQGNTITNTATGVRVSCGLGGNTVTGNTINEAGTGIAVSPNNGNSVAPNAYFNVDSMVGPC